MVLARRITQTEPGPVAGGGTSFQACYQKSLLGLPGDGVQSEWGVLALHRDLDRIPKWGGLEAW